MYLFEAAVLSLTPAAHLCAEDEDGLDGEAEVSVNTASRLKGRTEGGGTMNVFSGPEAWRKKMIDPLLTPTWGLLQA